VVGTKEIWRGAGAKGRGGGTGGTEEGKNWQNGGGKDHLNGRHYAASVRAVKLWRGPREAEVQNRRSEEEEGELGEGFAWMERKAGHAIFKKRGGKEPEEGNP